MDYALVLRALGRHVGIAERSLQFFRERNLGRQFEEGLIVLDEAVRARDEVIKMRELYNIQQGLFASGIEALPPMPFPPDTSGKEPEKVVDFPDEPLVDAPIRPKPETSPLKAAYDVSKD